MKERKSNNYRNPIATKYNKYCNYHKRKRKHIVTTVNILNHTIITVTVYNVINNPKI